MDFFPSRILGFSLLTFRNDNINMNLISCILYTTLTVAGGVGDKEERFFFNWFGDFHLSCSLCNYECYKEGR